MLHTDHVDIAVNCNKLYNSLLCSVCDKGGGTRLRYLCGHTVCNDCVNLSQCLICLKSKWSSQPVVDNVLSARVENASNLLTAYQELYSFDVYKKQKLSEKLKIEKQLFPDCIQAPVKYHNKRKTLNNSFQDKENQLRFLGEEIPLNNSNMDNKINLVKKWLAKNEKVERKPLEDLSINKQRIVDKNNTLKRNQIATLKERVNSTVKNLKSKKQKAKYFKNKNTYLSKELGASMKISKQKINVIQIDDEPIEIEDSQVEKVDKDKEAWHMVLAAHKHELDEKTKESKNVFFKNDNKVTKSNELNNYKVPFYKKSCLRDRDKFCDECISENNDFNSKENNDVTIVVTNNSFTTCIKVSKESNSLNRSPEKRSIEVQTDGIQFKTEQSNNDIPSLKCSQTDQINKINQKSTPLMFSEDLFPEERQPTILNPMKNSDNKNVCNIGTKKDYIVIDDSDSDDSNTAQLSMEVKADIHRSYNEFDYRVLSEVSDEAEHSRKRRPARGYTPDSSNSSEKENFHPNKQKRAKHDKKNTCKK